tara:strand:- start:49 stop:510 length:462 start_codon:yes stop_codon:yes gene_type:complete
MANSWIEHVKAYAKKNGVSYKEAITKARPSYKKQNAKDRKDESKGMKGQVKGTKSKSKRNFETKVKADPKRGRKKMAKKGMETVELDGEKVSFRKGGLKKSLKVGDDYTFKRSELNKLKKVENGEMFTFHSKKMKMTPKLKKQIVLGLNLMKK